MKRDEQIKVLILEDNRDHVSIAKAGLIPLRNTDRNNIDVKTRAQLADEIFHIEHRYTITDALSLLHDFKPDLAIIDVDLNDTCDNSLGLTNGIEFYRHLEKEKVLCKVLFSAHFGNEKYHDQLSEQEKAHFIPKATSGVGYEILAKRISSYLKQIAKNIIGDPILTIKNKIENDLLVQSSFDNLQDYIYVFNGRKIKAKYLLLFTSYLETTNGTEPKVLINYTNPLEALSSLISEPIIAYETQRYRAEWAKGYIQNAIITYHHELATEYEPEVVTTTTTSLKCIFENVNKKPDKRLLQLNLTRFAPHSYRGYTLKNASFLRNFKNALLIRRMFIFLEHFNRKYFDLENNSFLKSDAREFLRNFVNEVFQAIKKSSDPYSSKQLSQFGDMLNLSFLEPNDSTARGSVNLESNALLDCEKAWLRSPMFNELTNIVLSYAKR